jgi:hypothetical protein
MYMILIVTSVVCAAVGVLIWPSAIPFALLFAIWGLIGKVGYDHDTTKLYLAELIRLGGGVVPGTAIVTSASENTATKRGMIGDGWMRKQAMEKKKRSEMVAQDKSKW